MKKRFLKSLSGVTMIMVLALVSAVASVRPQVSNKVIANIPFAFSVGYKTMPAGEYTVLQINNSNGLLIQSMDGKTSAVRLSSGVESSKTQSLARLVFHRYGEHYFLAQVWNDSDKTGRELTKSQEERNIESELASNETKETVEVIAALR